VIKLVLTIALVAASLALLYYLYERAKELRLAEERATAVGERVFEIGPGAPVATPAEGE
jgi:hypothetical protein